MTNILKVFSLIATFAKYSGDRYIFLLINVKNSTNRCGGDVKQPYSYLAYFSMRVVVQRVKSASVVINKEKVSSIGSGLLAFVGFEDDDNEEDLNWMVSKLLRLRIFDDADGLMNLSIGEVDGQILVVSQFTLHAKTKKGNRPSFIKAAHPDIAIPLYNRFVQRLKSESETKVEVGVFGAEMLVSLENDGPVTLFIDTKNKE